MATAAAAALLVVVVVVTLTRQPGGTGTEAASSLVPAPIAVGNAILKPKPLPRVPLVNEDGKPTSLSSFKGKWVVFAPSMTLCHEVCPMTTGALNELSALVKKEGLSSKVVVATVTVDPWRDRPAQLRAYKRMVGVNFKMLTGKVGNVLRLWKHLGILVERVPLEKPDPIDWYTHKPETLNIVHSDGLFVLNPAGRLELVVSGMASVAGHRVNAALHKLLDAEGIHNLKHPETPWTASELMDDLDWGMDRKVPASSLTKSEAPSRQVAEEELSGSPTTLAKLHSQASALLGGSAGALEKRIGGLRGHPVVVNVWASWCTACRAEYPLMASAAAAYGRQVAFLGYDSNDQAGPARKYVAAHPVSYPSYAGPATAISGLATIEGMPTTIFLNAEGKVVHVHIGLYETQTPLDQDIERYALGKSGSGTGVSGSGTGVPSHAGSTY